MTPATAQLEHNPHKPIHTSLTLGTLESGNHRDEGQ